MMPQQSASLSLVQIALIEKCPLPYLELQANNFPSMPSQLELCHMAERIKQKHFKQLTAIDVAVYLRERVEDERRMRTPKNGSSSIFRQFAENRNDRGKKNEKIETAKEYFCRSKRKIRPTAPFEYRTLDETVVIMDKNTADCHSQFEKRGRKITMSQTGPILHQSCLWPFHELFYSSLDKPYLQQDEPFTKILSELDIPAEKLTYLQHRMIRRAIPAPRTFSNEFIEEQVFRVNELRSQARSRQRGKDAQLGVGKEVFALHPICGHLHTGNILAIYKENQFMVKFLRPELGTQKVLDVLMTAKELTSPHKIIVENMDFEVMALAIRLLELKADLVKLLRQYNTKAKELQTQEISFDNLFFQDYGWIGSTINILNLGIRHVVSKFRVRRLTPANQDRMGKHFSSILINPLTLMDKELEKSSEPSDIFASKQIKNIINTHRESRREYWVKELFAKSAAGIAQGGLDPPKKEMFQKLMKSIIGILVTLKYESRSFSIEQNKQVSELMSAINREYPEHVNEIFEILHAIASKAEAK